MRVLADLDFISGIEQGWKPCFIKRIYVEATSYYGSFHRMVYNESGRDGQQRIRNIFHEAINAYNIASNSDTKKIILQKIQEAHVGLNNLLQTYERVPEVKNFLRVLNLEIQTWLKSKGITTVVLAADPTEY